MIHFVSKFKYELALGILIAFYIGIFSYLSIKRYQTLNSHYYDLGIMNQVVYNTSQGRILEMTDQQLKKNLNRLAIHFDPILIVFVPLYKIYQGPEVLLVVQTVVLALGALAIFLISQEIVGKKQISLLFSLSYLCYFPIQRTNLFDFHAVTLASTFLLFAIYFNLIKKNIWSFVFILLALLTKEHVGLIVFLFGLYQIFFRKERKFGLIIAALGIIFFVSIIYFIIPFFRKENHFALKYFADFGDQPTQIVTNFFRHPRLTLSYLFRQETVSYIVRMMTPNFYSLFSLPALLISLPEWVINIFSTNGNMRSIYFHYNSLIVPFIFYSLILGYKNFNKIIKNRIVRKIALFLFIYLNLYSFYLYNPPPVSLVREPVILYDIDKEKIKTINNWKKILKNENIKLATTPKLAPFFTERKYYFNFLYDPSYALMGYTDEDVLKDKNNDYKFADYVIIDKTEIGDLSTGSLPVKFYQNFREDKNFQTIFSDNKTIEVYKKL